MEKKTKIQCPLLGKGSKAILSFSLPDDKYNYNLAVKGGEFHSVLWELDKNCRGFLKHGHKFKSINEVLEWVRNQIPYDLLYEEGV